MSLAKRISNRHLNNMPIVGSLVSWSYAELIKLKNAQTGAAHSAAATMLHLTILEWETIMHFVRWTLIMKKTLTLPYFLYNPNSNEVGTLC